MKQLIETGQLVQLHSDHRWPLTWSYYLVAPQQNVMREEVKVFHDWLVQDVLSKNSPQAWGVNAITGDLLPVD